MVIFDFSLQMKIEYSIPLEKITLGKNQITSRIKDEMLY